MVAVLTLTLDDRQGLIGGSDPYGPPRAVGGGRGSDTYFPHPKQRVMENAVQRMYFYYI